MNEKEIIRALRIERRLRELSQECVALSIGVGSSSISHMEKLSHRPMLSTAIAYAEFLGMELILRRKEEK